MHGRAALCGSISGYNATEPPPGPRNMSLMVGKRLTLRGFLVGDHADLRAEATDAIAGWLRSGELVARETVYEGLDRAVPAFLDLLRGANTGKMVVRLAPGRARDLLGRSPRPSTTPRRRSRPAPSRSSATAARWRACSRRASGRCRCCGCGRSRSSCAAASARAGWTPTCCGTGWPAGTGWPRTRSPTSAGRSSGSASEHGDDVPVVLVGHSMGGRAVLRAGGEPGVAAVCALAPWTPPGEPVGHLRGRTVVLLHGRGDRWVPAGLSADFAVRAQRAGARIARFTVAGGHSMVRRSGVWHGLVRDVVLAGAGLGPERDDVRAALDAPPPAASPSRWTPAAAARRVAVSGFRPRDRHLPGVGRNGADGGSPAPRPARRRPATIDA